MEGGSLSFLYLISGRVIGRAELRRVRDEFVVEDAIFVVVDASSSSYLASVEALK
jgi:hypothetical protein